ncbi:hypothetical protein [Candidatus Nitrospira bockiana]
MTHPDRRWRRGVFLPLAFFLLPVIPVLPGSAENLWVYEVANSVALYQAHERGGEWQPYIDRLDAIKRAEDRRDREAVRAAAKELLHMLKRRAHGIRGDAADELERLVFAYSPLDARVDSAASSTELSLEAERPMRAPAEPIARCHEAGCDEWLEKGRSR